MNLLVNNEVNECVALLINALPVCHFKKFIECDGKHDDLFFSYGICLHALEKDDEALEYIKKAADLYTDFNIWIMSIYILCAHVIIYIMRI